MKKQLTQQQLEYKAKIEDAKKSLQDAKKYLKDTLENCPHCYQFKISKMFCHDDIDVKCHICGEERISICGLSPDWNCHYIVNDGYIYLKNGKRTVPPVADSNGEEIPKDYHNDDACIFCGEPEERK